MEKIRVLYLDAKEGKELKEREVRCDTNEEFYDLIRCDVIDVTTRMIGNKRYRIIVDDEGLLKLNPIVSAVYKGSGIVALVGNLIIAGEEDRYGELTSLTDEDIKEIKKEVVILRCTHCGRKYYAIKVW